MREEEKKMSSLRIVGGKDGPENGSARLEGDYCRIWKIADDGPRRTGSGDHLRIAIRTAPCRSARNWWSRVLADRFTFSSVVRIFGKDPFCSRSADDG